MNVRPALPCTIGRCPMTSGPDPVARALADFALGRASQPAERFNRLSASRADAMVFGTPGSRTIRTRGDGREAWY